MGVLRALLTSVLVVLFAAAFLYVVVGINGDRTLLSGQFVKDQLRESDAYSFAVESVLPSIVEESARTIQDLPLTVAETVTLVQRAFDPSWLQAHVENAIDQIWAYGRGDAETFVVRVDLTTPRDLLVDNLRALLEGKYDALPLCQRADVEFDGFPTCRLPAQLYAQAAEEADQQVRREIAEVFPDELVFTPDDLAGDVDLFRGRELLTGARGLAYWGIVILAGLWALIAGSAGGGLARRLVWMATAVLVPAAITLGAATVVRRLATERAADLFGQIQELPQDALAGIDAIVAAAAGTVIGGIQTQMATVLAGAALLLGLALFLRWRARRDT